MADGCEREVIEAFQSALPVRGAMMTVFSYRAISYVSIRAPCEGSDDHARAARFGRRVSIRAPCEGSDLVHSSSKSMLDRFNPRSL